MRLGQKAIVIPFVLATIWLSPGALIRWKIQQTVVAKAPELLGPARCYSADVTGGLLDVMRGKLPRISIRGTDVRLKNGVVVNRLDVMLKGVHFKIDQSISDVDNTTFSALLSQDHLRNYLRASRTDMSEADVTLSDGKLMLTAKPRVMGIKTPVKVECTMEIVDNAQLKIVVNKLSARGIKVPGFVRGRIQRDANPVLDTREMGIGAKLTKVTIAKGNIALCGTADVKQALAAK